VSSEEPDEEKHERAVIMKFEALRNQDDGEIQWKWLLPKFPKTDMEERKELSRTQHETIGYFRIQPAISEGAFTLGEYSALGRHLKKLKYKLGKLPEKLKPSLQMPECVLDGLNCDACDKKEYCLNEVDEMEDVDSEPTPLGKLLNQIVSKAGSMLGESTWKGMEKGLGPRFGGLRSKLAAITLGIRMSGANPEAFLPFEKLSAGEKYALSFALATTRLTGASKPIIVMEEPETALYPNAIGQVVADLQSINSPQVIISSHSEAVLRRFAMSDVFRIGIDRQARRLDKVIADEDIRWAAEQLMTPGSTSALFAERVLVVEGGGDAFAFGDLDRLAGIVTDDGQQQKFLASLSWTVFSANKAEHIPDTITALREIGIGKIAALFDGDDIGLSYAQKVKDKCPTFVYKSSKHKQPTLELALLFGFDAVGQTGVATRFQSHEECKGCSNRNLVDNCLEKNACHLPKQITKERIKGALRRCCIQEYETKKIFPPAFKKLARVLDSAKEGEIIEITIEPNT